MSIQDLGSIGEFVAAIATLATLVYLALQIRQNHRSVRSAAVQSVLQTLNQNYYSGASSPDTARIIIDGQTHFDDLPRSEQYQFVLWLLSFLRSLELAHQHYLSGSLSDSVWKGMELQVGALLQSTSIVNIWRTRSQVFSQEFQEFMEAMIDSPSGISAGDAKELLFGNRDKANDA